jgi:hypothetical protein
MVNRSTLWHFIKTYPHWYYSFLSGVFIFMFLKVFKPFGFQQVPDDILNPLFIGYGLIGSLCVMINHWLLGGLVNRSFPDKSSIVRAWIWPIWIVLTIMMVNIFYTRWYFIETGLSTPRGFQSWPVIIGTLALGVLCAFIIEIIDQNIRLRQNLKTQQLANQKLKTRLAGSGEKRETGGQIVIIARNNKDAYQFETDDFLFLSAEENYVAIHYRKEKIERMLIRNTISAVADQLKSHYPLFFRCHRRYLVHIRKIRSVTGNAQGFTLVLDQVPEAIPVSRSYVPEFRKIVKENL